jgi:hypothetical protein
MQMADGYPGYGRLLEQAEPIAVTDYLSIRNNRKILSKKLKFRVEQKKILWLDLTILMHGIPSDSDSDSGNKELTTRRFRTFL